jgi:hypothetical protein
MFLGVAEGQGQRTFSHRLHLQLKLECVACHQAAPTSTRLEDNLLPAREVCLPCHKEASTGAPPVTRLARFNHQLHLKMGNLAPAIAAAIDHKTYLSVPPPDLRRHLDTKNACEACHRGMEESERAGAADMPRMADCLVCHNRIDNPFSCEFCHNQTAGLKPADHTPEFLDSHTTGKLKLDKTTCAVCHGRRFTCLGCHS